MKIFSFAFFFLWIIPLCNAQTYIAPLPSAADILNPGSLDNIRWGPEVGLNFDILSSTQYFADASLEGKVHNGTDNDLQKTIFGFGFLAGFAVDISFTPSIGFLGSVHYDSRSASRTANEPVQFTFYSTVPPFVIVDSTIASQSIKATVSYLTVNPAVRFTIGNIYGFAGASIGFPLSGTASFVSQLPQGGALYYNYGTPQQSYDSSTGTVKIPDMKTRVALELGAGKYFEIAPGTFLTPEIVLDYAMTKINNADAKMSSIQFILGLRFQ